MNFRECRTGVVARLLDDTLDGLIVHTGAASVRSVTAGGTWPCAMAGFLRPARVRSAIGRRLGGGNAGPCHPIGAAIPSLAARLSQFIEGG